MKPRNFRMKLNIPKLFRFSTAPHHEQHGAPQHVSSVLRPLDNAEMTRLGLVQMSNGAWTHNDGDTVMEAVLLTRNPVTSRWSWPPSWRIRGKQRSKWRRPATEPIVIDKSRPERWVWKQRLDERTPQEVATILNRSFLEDVQGADNERVSPY